ncbi:MAG: TATA box-binding protein [Candidatus Methanomethylicota archaeon]|uniref:DNA helicase n=1 Tax=Thermoproteota archaeon TaxID=2056631 RepID=A0A497EW60_9CREN|nr:MAG: TATA box-binding protein [Candidatus Verstraetearchaeota archaeon]RLE54567.1 MAG: TATA box-binding protein [Candidatus Verstraetearchaeota archaeon]
MAVSIREIGFIRVGAHSHIKGLGLKDGKALMKADGMVGQIEAREAAGIIVDLIKQGKMAGRGILLAGPPGTGKTAIAVAIAKELGEDVPFIAISGSEIYSSELKKTEVLMQAMRKAIGVRIHEFRKVYEGMVSDLDIKMTRHPYNPYQQIPESAKIKLKTRREEKTLTVGSSIAMQLIARGVSVGDVIWIDAETGRVTKLGRCKEHEGPKYDIEAEAQVPLPEGAVLKEKEFVYTVTLHDLDVRMHSSSGGLFSLLFGGREEKEIPPDVRQEVDNLVKKWVDDGRAEIIPGVMFIDEASALDIEAFSFLGRAMESELAPIIILATNRGITKIRGTDIESPHGIPLDILDRLMIITTRKYKAEEIKEILKIRAGEEGVKLSEKALEKLTEIGEQTSLRYAVQMLTPAQIIAKRKGREEVLPEDVEEVRNLFADVKQSTRYLKEHEEEMLK